MNFEEEINVICDISNQKHTDADILRLRQLYSSNLQVAKFITNLGEGNDIHIGDSIYQGTDAKVIHEIVRTLLQELQQTPRKPISIASELIATLSHAKFKDEEGERGGFGSSFRYEIYLEDVVLEDEQNNDSYQLYKLRGNWQSFVGKYVYAFNTLVDTPWGHNKRPYGRFEVVVKTINGVLDQIRVKADRYDDSANNYAANKVEQLIELKIRNRHFL